MAKLSGGVVGWGLALVLGIFLIGKCTGEPLPSDATGNSGAASSSDPAPLLASRYVLARTGLNCRASPSASGRAVTRLPVNTRVDVAEEEGTWSRLLEHGCWASSAYLGDSPIAIDPPRARSLSAYSQDRPSARPARSASSAYYANCSAARAAGAAPVYASEPGYSRRLDRDGDGVGCE